MNALLAPWIVLGMVALAIVVQIGVWGATKLRSRSRPRRSVCVWLAIDRGITWLVRTWAIAGGALVLLWLATGRPDRPTIDSGVALTAGLGALVLAAGLYEGHLAPRRP